MAGLSIAVLLLLMLGLYRETTLDLGSRWAQWQDGGYGHGYLVLAISLYLVYRQRHTLARLVPCPSPAALFAIAAFSLFWLIAALVDVQMVQSAVLLPLVVSVIWAAAGRRVAWQLLFPVLFIGFAIPVWSPLLPVLQAMTAEVVFWMVRASGLPALLQDYIVILPAGRLMIAEACSGLHYLLAALTLGVFYAYLNYQQFRHRVLVVIVVAAAAIVANILRVFIVVYLAYTSGMQHPLVEDHLSLGWYLFAGVVFVLLLVDLGVPHPAGGPAVDVRPAGKTAAGEVCVCGTLQRLLLFTASVVLVALGPALAWWFEQTAAAGQDIVLDFPVGAGGWSGPSTTEDSWMPLYQGAIAKKRVYADGPRQLYLYIGYYPVQSQGSELINDLNRISDGNTWHSRFSPEKVTTDAKETVLEQVLESTTGQQRLVWYWYQVAGQTTANAYDAKLLQLRGVMTGNQQAAVVAVATDIETDAVSARRLLKRFISVMQQPLLLTGNRHY